MSYEFNLLHHVGVVARRVRAAETAAQEGDDIIPLGPMGRGEKLQMEAARIHVLVQCVKQVLIKY